MPLQCNVRLLVEVKLSMLWPSLRQQGVPVVELVVLLEELVEQMEVAVELPQRILGQHDFQGLVGENRFFCDLPSSSWWNYASASPHIRARTEESELST